MKLSVVVLVLLGAVPAAAPPAFAGESPAGAAEALRKTDSFAGGVLSRLRGLRSALDTVQSSVDKSSLSDEDKRALARQITETRTAVNAGVGLASSIKGYTGSAAQAMDLYGEVESIRNKARALDLDGGGNLGTSLLALSRLLKSHGGKVPLLGSALEAYGDVTEKLLDALAGLARVIEENRRQGHVGAGTSTEEPHRNNVLWKQDPAVFKADTYAPCAPPYAYRSIEAANEWRVLLLWDEPNDRWYVIRGRVEAESVYRDHLLTGRTPSAKALRDVLEPAPYRKHMEARAMGEKICRYFDDLSARDLTWAGELAKTDLPYYDVPLFRASFALDAKFPPRVWALMKLFFDRYHKAKRPDLAGRVRDRAVSFGCAEARNWKPPDGTGGTGGGGGWSAYGTPAVKWKSEETTGVGSAKYSLLFGAMVQVKMSPDGRVTFGRIVPFRGNTNAGLGGKVRSGRFRISFVKAVKHNNGSISILTRSEVSFSGVLRTVEGTRGVSHQGTKQRGFLFSPTNGHRGLDALKDKEITLGPPAGADFTAKGDDDGSLGDAMKVWQELKAKD